jgi:thymidylate synthase
MNKAGNSDTLVFVKQFNDSTNCDFNILCLALHKVKCYVQIWDNERNQELRKPIIYMHIDIDDPPPKYYKKTNDLQNFIAYSLDMDNLYQETKYLKAMKQILDEGEEVVDRTGVGTLSVFDMNLSFEITVSNPEAPPNEHQYTLPIFTTKSLFFRGIVGELLWFLRGETDTKILSEQKIRIWDGNTSREALDKRGLSYEEGELGPGYGYQWIHWGATWPDRSSDAGINQIKQIIHTLQTEPRSRRMVLNAWNVDELDKMALPPCHMMYIFKVTNTNVLNCKVILRSNDMFLGNPFNVVSASVLTILIARTVGMIPGRIALSITDAHIYMNHIEQVKEQLTREPREPPTLTIDVPINSYEDITNLNFNNFTLSKYSSWPRIDAPMAV